MSGSLTSSELRLLALPGLPIITPGADLAGLLMDSARRAGLSFTSTDVLVLASKIISRAEDRFVVLRDIDPTPEAIGLAALTGKDPRLVTLVLRESVAVSRATAGVLLVRHRLGITGAMAGIDASNVAGDDETVLLWPEDPDASAAALSAKLGCAVIIADSLGRPFRLGTVAIALGAASVPVLWDQKGDRDLFGRPLMHTVTAVADQIAAAAELLMGQAAEGQPAVLLRGLGFEPSRVTAAALIRPLAEDLYA